jgi:hypothetical protein
MNWNSFVVTFIVAALFAPATSFAAAIEFTSAPVAHDSQLSLGFRFTTNEALDVTSLGYYDDNQDGFVTSHEVGIFDENGALLISAVLGAGSTASLDGHYRYVPVTPITLAANSSFVIAATTFGEADAYAYGIKDATIAGFVVDPRIDIASDAARFLYQNDNTLRLPTDQFGGYTIYGGPNFLLAATESSTVPEPANFSITLAGVAGFLLICGRQRMRRFTVCRYNHNRAGRTTWSDGAGSTPR